MVFYTVIMGIIGRMLMRQDLRRTGGPLQATMCLLEESSLMEE